MTKKFIPLTKTHLISTINYIRIFFKYSVSPVKSTFNIWKELILSKHPRDIELWRKDFYDDMSFFSIFNEDFFQWYIKEEEFDNLFGK